jgi:hypothetical protein
MGLSTEMVKHLIHDHGADPAYFGRRAHRVIDSVVLDKHRIAIKTPRWGWRILDERKVQPAKRREQSAVARVPEPGHITIQLHMDFAG